MVIYIRNKKGDNIYEVELTENKDNTVRNIIGSINTKEFSNFLLERCDKSSNKKGIMEVIDDFNELSEIRGWYFENYIHKSKDYDDVLAVVKSMLKSVASKYDLAIVED